MYGFGLLEQGTDEFMQVCQLSFDGGQFKNEGSFMLVWRSRVTVSVGCSWKVI